MRTILMVSIAAVLVICCNKQVEKGDVIKETTEKSCYNYFDNKDSIEMTITIQGESLSGELMYKLFEKDRNDGQLNGKLSGDTIIAVYEFESEGIRSEREVAFLRKGTSLVEGFGTMDTTGTHFSSHRDLTFSGMELRKTDCL